MQKRHDIAHQPLQIIAHQRMRKAGPAHFNIGYIEGRLRMKFEQLSGYRTWAANNEVDGMGAKVGGRCWFAEVRGDFSLFLKAAPKGSERGFDEFKCSCIVGGDEDWAIGGDLARAAGGGVGGAVLPILLGGAEMGKEHVEIEKAGDAGGADAVHCEPAAVWKIG